MVGAPWAEAGGTLKPTDVRTAIGKLLNAGSLADSSLNEESMRKKWAKIQRTPDSMKAKKPEKTWPKMTANIGAVAKSGQSKYIYNVIQYGIRKQKENRYKNENREEKKQKKRV